MLRYSNFLALLLLMSPPSVLRGDCRTANRRPSHPCRSLTLDSISYTYRSLPKHAKFSQAGSPTIGRILLVRWPWPRAIFLKSCTSKGY
jgi:hypothetical protein